MVRFYLEFTLGLPNPYKLMCFDRNINGNRNDKFFEWDYWALHRWKNLTLVLLIKYIHQYFIVHSVQLCVENENRIVEPSVPPPLTVQHTMHAQLPLNLFHSTAWVTTHKSTPFPISPLFCIKKVFSGFVHMSTSSRLLCALLRLQVLQSMHERVLKRYIWETLL